MDTSKELTISNSHVISALVSKHAELLGLVEHHQKLLDTYNEELEHISASIKIFEPSYKLKSTKRKPVRTKNRFFEHGESKRLCMDVMRNKGTTMKTTEIVEAVAEVKNINLSYEEQITVDNFYKTIANSLRSLEKDGYLKVVENGEKSNQNKTWELQKDGGLFLRRAG